MIDDFVDDGSCDLVRRYSGLLQVQVIFIIIAIPDGEAMNLGHWADDTMLLLRGAPDLDPGQERELADRARPVMDWLYEFVDETPATARRCGRNHHDARRRGWSDRQPPDRRRRYDEELHRACHPGASFAFRPVGRDPGRPIATRQRLGECLRLRSPWRGSRRLATRQVRIGDVIIPKARPGPDPAVSPQRDDSVFADPDRLDIHRSNAGRHYAFGR
ncbi:MAG TPA: hypothetical protein VJL81_17465 [Solirubrobacterales bacterium]|nr:hypothetical protein [Solirubrobacterales bacterium]